MNNLEFTGKLIYKGDVQSGVSASGKQWSKMSFVVQDDAQYPNSMLFEAFNKTSFVEKVSIGSEVKVKFNALARQYKGNYFNTLSMYSLEVINWYKETSAPEPEPQAENNPQMDSEQDDLPF